MRVVALVMALAGCGRWEFAPLADAARDDTPSSCFVDIGGGNAHTCALLRDGQVRCWGLNNAGQLGDGTFNTPRPAIDLVRTSDGQPLSDVIQISTGVEYTNCALRSDRTAWCWGNNPNGQLGNNSTLPSAFAVQVQLADILEIRTGEQHTCARVGSGAVLCWGLGDFGRLGNAATGPQLGTSMVQAPAAPSIRLMASWGHTCSIASQGALYCWGYNVSGQLGDNSNANTPTPTLFPVSNVTAVASAWRSTCASNGTAYCSGTNGNGELGDGSTTERLAPVAVRDATMAPLDRVVDVGAGDKNGCALRDDNTVWCWGDNMSNQLGTSGGGSLHAVLVPLTGPAVKLAVGNTHACAVLADDRLECWGENIYGELGDGTTDPRTSPVIVPLGCP